MTALTRLADRNRYELTPAGAAALATPPAADQVCEPSVECRAGFVLTAAGAAALTRPASTDRSREPRGRRDDDE